MFVISVQAFDSICPLPRWWHFRSAITGAQALWDGTAAALPQGASRYLARSFGISLVALLHTFGILYSVTVYLSILKNQFLRLLYLVLVAATNTKKIRKV
jgi:hypothetical protein